MTRQGWVNKMASRVKELTNSLIGRKAKGIGSTMYAAGDGSHDGGELNSEKGHKMRKALHKLRLRASGMSDDIWGSKEVSGRFENDYEQIP
jgi:hypothetical protein